MSDIPSKKAKYCTMSKDTDIPRMASPTNLPNISQTTLLYGTAKDQIRRTRPMYTTGLAKWSDVKKEGEPNEGGAVSKEAMAMNGWSAYSNQWHRRQETNKNLFSPTLEEPPGGYSTSVKEPNTIPI